MNGCIHRTEDGTCQKFTTDTIHAFCVDGPCEYAIPSRADRVRSMSDEELAQFMTKFADCNECPMYMPCENEYPAEANGCVMRWLDWLRGAWI